MILMLHYGYCDIIITLWLFLSVSVYSKYKVQLTLYSSGISDGYLASLPNIKKKGENFVVIWRLVLSPNMTASKCWSHSSGLSCTNLDSALQWKNDRTILNMFWMFFGLITNKYILFNISKWYLWMVPFILSTSPFVWGW